MSEYRYQPLPRKDCIRLLFLKPGYVSDPVHIHLLSVPLSEAPAFEALSYAWGAPDPSTRVLCGPRGEKITVRNNLLEALCHVRDESEYTTLWVDALCINQANEDEKSNQVRMMGLIYWRAARVIVWLGLDDDEECLAAEVFELIGDWSSVATSLISKHGEANAIPAISLSDLSKLDDTKWNHLARFFKKRTWFRRGWVVQELGLAANAILICGDAQLDLETYLPFVRWLYTSGHLIVDKFRISAESQWLASEYWLSTRARKGTTHLSFVEVLDAASSVQCTDCRDYVYAFLGHPSAFEAFEGDTAPYADYESNFREENNRRPIIKADYGMTERNVYTELAKNLMRRDSNLSVLYWIVPCEASLEGGFPSWVPHWGLRNRLCALSVHPYYDASLDSQAFFNFEGDRLRLRGIHVDTVLWTSHVWEDFALGFYDPSNTAPERWGKNRLEGLWKMCCSLLSHLHRGKEPDRRAFLYTLTAGTINGEPAEEEGNEMQFEKNVAAYELQKMAVLNTELSTERVEKLKLQSQGGNSSQFLTDAQQISESRALFVTRGGRFGLGHSYSAPGDRIYVLQGASIPFVIRKYEEDRKKRIISTAYVHGMMRGEAFVEEKLIDIVVH